MIQHIQTAMFYQIHSRELHDLPDLCLILTMVTLSFTFLTHRLGIMRAFHPHGQTVSKDPCAIRTEGDFLLLNSLNTKEFEREWSFRPVMMLPAENPDELHQGPNVVLLFV